MEPKRRSGLRGGGRALCGWILAAAAMLAPLPRAVAQQAGGSSRERSGLAEDQALLQRQLARLKQTMEILAARFETEGRTHAAKLLREGLAHLGERRTEQESKTVDELMGGARSSLEAGQTVQAVEVQESVVKSLEKLYSILTDRQGLDDLEHSLEALKKIKDELAALADREKDLREKTASLEDAAASPERKELLAGIETALDAQRKLLGRTETEARESGEMEIEAIARDLEALLARQSTDAAVLRSWKPEERSALDASSSPLGQAAARAAAAQRLAQAAHELREAAAAARDAKRDLAAAARDVDSSASREERRDRAAGDGADSRASKALRAGAKALSDAAATPDGRQKAAQAVDEQAAALEQAAESELTSAQTARQAAEAALSSLAGKKSAAGEVADRTLAATSRAPKAGADAHGKSLEDRAEEESRADAEAKRTLSGGLDEEATLPKALSASQSGAAEDAQRLDRALGGRPEGRSSAGEEARKDLQAAAESQQKAAESASKGAADDAAAEAKKAEEDLARARDALARARAESAAGSPRSEAQRALAGEQKELAKSIESLERKAEAAASSSSASSPSGDAKTALSTAKSAMQSAAKSLESGSPASASSSQRQAIEQLQQAAEGLRKGSNPTSPEDREKAKELAKEQERIRNELLDLARRNEKRDAAKPTPSLAQAGSSAGKAKESLDEADLQNAQSSEEDAEHKMREAVSQLSEEEEQYQKLRAEELLFKVAEQVKGMLETHREQMKETVAIDGARKPGDAPTHTQRLRLRKVSKAEETLATHAAEVEKAIRAEESLVFAEVLNEAGRDLLRAAKDLGEEGGFQSGDRVQAVQQDVEQSLSWLYDSLQFEKERRRKEDGAGSSQQQRGKNRLVPDAAELKLLRQLEVEHLDALEKFKAAHPELPGNGEVDPMLLEDLARLASRHQRTSDLFEKFRKRLGLPDPPPQEP